MEAGIYWAFIPGQTLSTAFWILSATISVYKGCSSGSEDFHISPGPGSSWHQSWASDPLSCMCKDCALGHCHAAFIWGQLMYLLLIALNFYESFYSLSFLGFFEGGGTQNQQMKSNTHLHLPVTKARSPWRWVLLKNSVLRATPAEYQMLKLKFMAGGLGPPQTLLPHTGMGL